MTEQDSIRLDLGELSPEREGQWIEITPRRTYADRLAIRHASWRATDDGKVDVDMTVSTLTTIERAVIAWSFGDLPGCRCDAVRAKEIEICPRQDVIADLDDDVGDWLHGQILTLHARGQRSEAEKSGAVARPARRRR